MNSGVQSQELKLWDSSSRDTRQFWKITQVRTERTSQGVRDIQFVMQMEIEIRNVENYEGPLQEIELPTPY